MNSAQLKFFFSRYWILIALISIKFILQFVFVNSIYELHRDEFLHLNQASYPAFGYISVPPFTSWVASLIYLLGGELFWIRFFPALFGALTVVVAWLIVESLGGKLPAKILTSVFLIFSVYTRMNLLFQPNSFDILSWTIIFYLCINYLKNFHLKWIFLLAIITALGLYNKYTIVFLIFGLSIGLLITKERIVYSRKAFYYALGLSFLLFLPNIIWQITNDFPVIYHMQALRESQLVYVNRIDFWVDQAKYGLIGIPTIAALWALMFYQPFKPYRFVLWTFIVVMVLFSISRAKSYYTFGLYPVLFSFGAVYLEILLKKWKIILIFIIAIMNITTFILIAKYLMPFQTPTEIVADNRPYERLGLLRWEDGRNYPLPQDFADMIGWSEMAEKALYAYKLIPTDELEYTLIYCDNYGQAGALNYYNRNKMPMAYSFSTDYIFWLPKFKRIENILFVGQLPDEEVMDMFEDFRLVGEVENEFARERGTQIFLLMRASPNFTDLFYEIVEERKRNFDIF